MLRLLLHIPVDSTMKLLFFFHVFLSTAEGCLLSSLSCFLGIVNKHLPLYGNETGT